MNVQDFSHPQGFSGDLLFAALTVGTLGFIITLRYLSPWVAFTVTSIKISIPTLYFARYFTGKWLLGDDIGFYRIGSNLVRGGYSPLQIITPRGFSHIQSVAQTEHFIPHWWNVLGISVFGPHYYSPIFLSVLLTFISPVIFVDMLRRIGFQYKYRYYFLIFALLHWQVITWSSFVNLKDSIVLFLIVILLWSIVVLLKFQDLRSVITSLFVMSSSLFVLRWTRFYLIALFIFTMLLGVVIKWDFQGKFIMLSFPGVFLSWFIYNQRAALEFFNFAGIGPGIITFLITNPLWVNDKYSFIMVSVILSTLLFIPMWIGGLHLFRKNTYTKLLVIFLIICIIFFAAVPQFNTVRKQYQFSLLFAWFQFHFFWNIKDRVKIRI